MAGLDTRGLMDGALQGFSVADAYFSRQHNQKLQEDQNARADRQLGMQEENFNLQKQKLQGGQVKEKATFVIGKMAQGLYPTEDELNFLSEHPEFFPAFDPATDRSIEIAQAVIDPKDPMDPNDPQAIEAMNQLWGARVNRGAHCRPVSGERAGHCDPGPGSGR